MTVLDYIVEGICNGCDQCPICCEAQGYCEYDGPEQEKNDDDSGKD